jgi:hypothetical protein
MTQRDPLKEAHIIVARSRAKDLNRLPADVINLLEVVNGKMTVKGDNGEIPEVAAKAMNHADQVQAIAGNVTYKKL